MINQEERQLLNININSALIVMTIFWLFYLSIMLFGCKVTDTVSCNIDQDSIPILSTSYKKRFEKVKCSMYNAVPEQCWGDGTITYNGTTLKTEITSKYRIIAVSHDLKKDYPMGTLDYIEGLQADYNGVYMVADLMNKKWKNKIDFLKDHQTTHPSSKTCYISRI